MLADWVGKAAFHLKPVVDQLAEHLKRADKLFMDEITAPVLDPRPGKTKTGYLWTLAQDDRPWGGEDPPGVVYFYAPGRAGENAEYAMSVVFAAPVVIASHVPHKTPDPVDPVNPGRFTI